VSQRLDREATKMTKDAKHEEREDARRNMSPSCPSRFVISAYLRRFVIQTFRGFAIRTLPYGCGPYSAGPVGVHTKRSLPSGNWPKFAS
jgi:hypothetical protein